jgi:hypothetical protein
MVDYNTVSKYNRLGQLVDKCNNNNNNNNNNNKNNTYTRWMVDNN